MNRLHRVTHPIIGVATWREIQMAAIVVKAQTGNPVCSWCQLPVPARRRTCCGNPVCVEAIGRACSWGTCRDAAMYEADFRCALCGARARETDHIVPVSLGGTDDADNLRALCTDCHLRETRRLRNLGVAYVAEPSR